MFRCARPQVGWALLEIAELSNPGVHYRLLLFKDDGIPQPWSVLPCLAVIALVARIGFTAETSLSQ
jgi:hypothetical protein